jgi:hypothetical protein
MYWKHSIQLTNVLYFPIYCHAYRGTYDENEGSRLDDCIY